MCPHANTAHIYEEKGEYWACTLNLTDLGNNNNKFYKIELIESNGSPKVYSVWTRWGRVGYSGQHKLFPYASSLKNAKTDFEKKYDSIYFLRSHPVAHMQFVLNRFRDKTATEWEDRMDFQAVPGKYTLLEMALGEDSADAEDGDEDDDDVPASRPAAAPPKSAPSTKPSSANNTASSSGLSGLTTGIPAGAGPSMLDPRIQDFVTMIFDKKMMANTVAAMNYDVKKNPLGKLHKTTIKKAYAILKEVADVLQAQPGKKNNPKLIDLSNRFYTYIPHSAGMARLPYIDNDAILKEKLGLLATLMDVEIAEKLKKEEEANTADAHLHPTDRKYKSLGINLTPVERDDEIFAVLEKFVYNTHAPTHNNYGLKVLDIIEVDRPAEAVAFPRRSASIDNHQFMWHGSRMSNWVGILSQGLRIAPPEAPVTGYMFGKGVYFADISSKSANYCHANPNDPIGVLLVCEVALGKTLDRTKADYITSLPSGYSSVCGLGTSEPDPAQFFTTKDGVKVPYGKPQPNPNVDHSELLYNEFIVYDVDQIRMKYLIKLRFNFK